MEIKRFDLQELANFFGCIIAKETKRIGGETYVNYWLAEDVELSEDGQRIYFKGLDFALLPSRVVEDNSSSKISVWYPEVPDETK